MYRSWKFVVFTVLDSKERRDAATHAPLCNWVASDNQKSKTSHFPGTWWVKVMDVPAVIHPSVLVSQAKNTMLQEMFGFYLLFEYSVAKARVKIRNGYSI